MQSGRLHETGVLTGTGHWGGTSCGWAFCGRQKGEGLRENVGGVKVPKASCSAKLRGYSLQRGNGEI